MILTVYPNGKVTVVVAAAESIAVGTTGKATISRQSNYPQYPAVTTQIGTIANGQAVYGAYASGAVIVIEAGAAPVYYETGVTPFLQAFANAQYQPAPGVLNTTGTLTAAMIQAGIVTSTTAAAVAATLDTGTVMDASSEYAVGDSFDWSAIATGANAFTVTASSGHTLVGSGVVATVTSGHFRTRKTAANTFVTYRLS